MGGAPRRRNLSKRLANGVRGLSGGDRFSYHNASEGHQKGQAQKYAVRVNPSVQIAMTSANPCWTSRTYANTADPPSSVMNSRRLIIRSPRRQAPAASLEFRGRGRWQF